MEIRRLELQRMAVSFDIDRTQTFNQVFARLASPHMNWGYETGAAYGQPASEGYGRAASGQLRSGGGGVFDEFGQPVDLNALAMAIERARDAEDKAD